MAERKYLTKSFTIILPNGTTKRIKIRGKTPKELEDNFIQAQIAYQTGRLLISSDMFFSQWVHTYMTTYKATIGKAAYKSAYSIINNAFSPLFNFRLSEIKAPHIQKCFNDIADKSSSYIEKAKIYIKDIFRKAIDNELVVKDPTRIITIPPGDKGHRRALTKEEEQTLMETIFNDHRGPIFALSLACGLRPGEVRALQWKDIDLREKTLTVNRAIKAGTNDIGTPKSAAGRRTIPIPSWYCELLTKLSKTSIFVFPNKYGKQMTITSYKTRWQCFMRKWDIIAGAQTYRNKIIVHAIDQDITPYYFRHHYATQLAEKGINIKTAQYLLGHSDIKTTANIYTHVTKHMINEARALIEQ